MFNPELACKRVSNESLRGGSGTLISVGQRVLSAATEDSSVNRYDLLTLTRRGFLRLGGVMLGGIVTSGTGLLSWPIPAARAEVLTDSNSVLEAFGNSLSVEAIGYQISKAWNQDGFAYIAYQGAILQLDKNTGQVNLWNTLDQMHSPLNLDEKLDNNTLGVTVPPLEDFEDGTNGDLNLAFQRRIEYFGVEPRVVDWVNRFRQQFETGVFTSHGKDYGSYIVYRLQRIAVQVWKDSGQIERILVGDAYKAAGLIPQAALLSTPIIRGDNSESVPVYRSIDQPAVWFPLSRASAQRRGQPTLYDTDGPLAFADHNASRFGLSTNFRGQAEALATEYFAAFANMNPVLKDTTGFCHGVANAVALGEHASDNIGWGVLAAYHSGDFMYKPGGSDPSQGVANVNELMKILAAEGRPFVIETQDETGFWSRIAYELTVSGLIRATDFGRAPKEFSPSQIQNAYIPVAQGQEGCFPPGRIYPPIGPRWLQQWTFRIPRPLVDFAINHK